MSVGSLAVVEAWLDAVNRGDGPSVERLSSEDVELVGPRGTVRGRHVLSAWLTRSGFSAATRRWFCGAGGSVVVEQDARWADPASGVEQGHAIVASRFLVDGPCIARYERHDDLRQALAAAGLAAGDEVVARGPR